ncbi:hypothetical protein FQA39_LY03827 [Lamprigera yunnana]|nr:hypothetical protein FQA39_LY03827 [Lamprigera yunnana]
MPTNSITAASSESIELVENTPTLSISAPMDTPPPSTSACILKDALVGLQAPSTISLGNLISSKEILPLPKQSVRGSRKRGETVIVTSSPYMKELKDCQTQRCVKPPKQVKNDFFAEVPTSSKNCTQNRKLSSKSVKKDTRSSSSESYDSDDICQGSDISDFICDEGDELFEDSETKFTLDQKEICLNDFVSISLKEIKKHVFKEFVGQIIGVVEEVVYKVKFMRNYRQHADIFVFPEVDDVFPRKENNNSMKERNIGDQSKEVEDVAVGKE